MTIWSFINFRGTGLGWVARDSGMTDLAVVIVRGDSRRLVGQ